MLNDTNIANISKSEQLPENILCIYKVEYSTDNAYAVAQSKNYCKSSCRV